MRLLQLDDRGKPRLTVHDADKLPHYAILSHTWNIDDRQEVSFDDVNQGVGQEKSGYAKILFCGRQALKDGLEEFWVDTCCIDKRDPSELSEAILSMFRWYQKAAKCYVYLDDVSTREHDRDSKSRDWQDAFRKSRWFTRGWTLQELLAPKEVEFWSRDGDRLGTKEQLKDLIYETTGIATQALLGAPLSRFSIKDRLLWATKRKTKREEDKFYCLIWIFDVPVSMDYGEGEKKARARLLKAIWSSQMPLDDTADPAHQARRQVRDSLAFEQKDDRHSTIQDPQRMTCSWLMHHPDFLAWKTGDDQSSNNAILWITGKPGAGKSTLMKFLLAHLRQIRAPDEIILDFFFDARGDFFEKTTLGMYRALLFKLFGQAPDLQCVLDNICVDDLRGSSASTWTLKMLQDLFRAAVRHLVSRKLVVLVDALDECDEEQVRDMVEFLEGVGEHDLTDNSQLSICFASRPYPSIKVEHGWRLNLEDEAGHTRDLERFIDGRLQNSKKNEQIDEIRAVVQEKANSVFSWVALVVDILNEELQRGSIFAVKKRLLGIPTELSDLYKEVVQRDGKVLDDVRLCLQCILFAERPLSCAEFYHAMEAGLRGRGKEWRPQALDPENVTVEDMESLILHSSRGLAKLSKSKEAPTVQFIRESIGDFLKDGGLDGLWPELSGDEARLSHVELHKCCLNYLAADLTSYTDPSQPLPAASSAKGKHLRQRVTGHFPLLEYASNGVLHHANEATRLNTDEDVLQAFALDKWVYVNNILEPIDGRQYSNQVNLLYVLADKNLSYLIRSMQSPDEWLRLPQEKYKYPVLAAFANGNLDALLALLGEKSIASLDKIVEDPGFNNPDQECSPSQDPLQWATEHRNWALAEFLLSHYADNDIFSISKTMKRGDNVLSFAESGAPITVLQMLLVKNTDVNAGVPFSNALQKASLEGNERVVQILLNAGADLRMVNHA